MKKNAFPFYVLSNDVGTVLGVYGSAVVDHARERARKLVHEFARPIYLHCVLATYCDRPRVGQSISMKGQIERIGE